MKIEVRSAVADILKQENIEYTFGYTGGHISHLYQSVYDVGIKIILNRQEGNAAYMADGYARITKKPAVVLATAGPGATNMVTGLSSALMDSIPMVAICATAPTSTFGRNAVQDGSGRGRNPEQKAMFKACCKQAMLAPSPEAIPDMVREAFRIAISGRPGPVYVEIPSDFWNVEIEYESVEENKYKNTVLPGCNLVESEAIEEMLYKSKHPLIVIGEGADEEGIREKLSKLLSATKIPFAVSPIAKNYVDEHDELCLGSMRSEGNDKRAHEYMRRSDFILFLGDRMHHWEMDWHDKTLVENAKLAQVDSDYDEIGRVFPVDLSVVGSISSFIDLINKKKHKNSKELQKEAVKLNSDVSRERRYKDGDGINPFNINNIVEEEMARDGSVICDTGYNKLMAIMKFRTNLFQNFIVADKNGPMGYSVPASLGVALATDKEVICFVGDGGFQMSLNELGTAMEYGLKVIYIIENNEGCSMIKSVNESRYNRTCADSFNNPDFIKIAEGYKLEGCRVETIEEFEKIFKKAQKSDRSVVIDAKIDQSAMTW